MNNKIWSAKVKRIWGRKVAWIEGEGRYALISWCRVLTVMLFHTWGEAEERKRFIDEIGCGGCCIKKHYIIDLTKI